jgi:hypothetical protein
VHTRVYEYKGGAFLIIEGTIYFVNLKDKRIYQMMVDTIKGKGLLVAYITFEAKQHGFSCAENIKRALDAEFYFHSRFFGFEPAEKLEPIEMINLVRDIN